MRTWTARGVLVAVFALFCAGLWFVLAPRGLAWIVWTLIGLTAAFVILELALRGRRDAADAGDLLRWQSSLDDPSARRRAIGELRRRIDRARQLGRRLRVEHARLATVLAELLVADGSLEAASRTLARVPIDELDALQAAVVRQARAQTYLAAGDVESAESALSTAPTRTGQPVLDAALALSRAGVALGRGRVDEAEQRAGEVRDAAEEGDALYDEALAILAACHAARGDESGADRLIARIDDEGRRRLALVGPALVRDRVRA